jgi:hypothetical protein
MIRVHNQRQDRRRGATVVECAVVYPVTFLLLLGLVVGGLGVFRYQEVAALARAGARYASTHGAQFRKDAGMGTGTPGSNGTSQSGWWWYDADPNLSSGSNTSWTQDTYDNGVRPNQVALDKQSLAVKVGWPAVINQSDKADNWPGSRVSVTVTYQWLPEAFLIGPISLTSTSTMPITN